MPNAGSSRPAWRLTLCESRERGRDRAPEQQRTDDVAARNEEAFMKRLMMTTSALVALMSVGAIGMASAEAFVPRAGITTVSTTDKHHPVPVTHAAPAKPAPKHPVVVERPERPDNRAGSVRRDGDDGSRDDGRAQTHEPVGVTRVPTHIAPARPVQAAPRRAPVTHKTADRQHKSAHVGGDKR